jgi:hypothetical protein
MTMSWCMNCHTKNKVTNDCLACHVWYGKIKVLSWAFRVRCFETKHSELRTDNSEGKEWSSTEGTFWR